MVVSIHLYTCNSGYTILISPAVPSVPPLGDMVRDVGDHYSGNARHGFCGPPSDRLLKSVWCPRNSARRSRRGERPISRTPPSVPHALSAVRRSLRRLGFLREPLPRLALVGPAAPPLT